jgi:hypothetical protein
MALTPIQEISRAELQQLETPSSAVITNVRHLSSYNWVDASTPTIVVPGSPALWSPPKEPKQLKKDSGLVYIAQNAARHPESPLEPLFRALHITNPSFSIHSAHVVTERSSIRNLLAFVSCRRGSGNPYHAFAIKIEAVRNTVLLCGIDSPTHEFIGSHESKGFGHEFEKAYTSNQINDSTGHYRIVSYRFGGLNFIMCHETDGYADQSKAIQPSPMANQPSSPLRKMSPPEASEDASTLPGAASRLRVVKGGQVIPIGLTIEIKTRISHRPISIEDVAPQLWASQTPKLVRAYHRGGLFQRPQFDDVTEEIKTWEACNQPDLKKLAALMKRIIAIVKGAGTTVVVKYVPLGDKLLFFMADGGKMLPEDLYTKGDERRIVN